jgi:hypothetical protein
MNPTKSGRDQGKRKVRNVKLKKKKKTDYGKVSAGSLSRRMCTLDRIFVLFEFLYQAGTTLSV